MGTTFRYPARTADILGYTDEEHRDSDDIAADLDIQDNSIEDFLSNVVVTLSAGSVVIGTDLIATGTASVGFAPVSDGSTAVWTNVATQSELDAHLNDTSDAHDGSAISATSAGYSNSNGNDVQAILDDFDTAISGGPTTGGSAAVIRVVGSMLFR